MAIFKMISKIKTSYNTIKKDKRRKKHKYLEFLDISKAHKGERITSQVTSTSCTVSIWYDL